MSSEVHCTGSCPTPVITLPATDAVTATLADWLIRELAADALHGGGLKPFAGQIRSLPRITATHVENPRRFSVYERQLQKSIRVAEARLAIGGDSTRSRTMPIRRKVELPLELVDAASHIVGAITDVGSPAAALACQAVSLAFDVASSGAGTQPVPEMRFAAIESYRRVLTSLWLSEPHAKVELKA